MRWLAHGVQRVFVRVIVCVLLLVEMVRSAMQLPPVTAALVLVFMAQTSVAPLLNRLAQQEVGFSTSAAVLAGEAIKLPLCVVLMWATEYQCSVADTARALARGVGRLSSLRHAVVLSVLYTLQNLLAYVAAQRLLPYVMSVLQQSKLLTTVLFSFLLLGRRLPRQQLLILVSMGA